MDRQGDVSEEKVTAQNQVVGVSSQFYEQLREKSVSFEVFGIVSERHEMRFGVK